MTRLNRTLAVLRTGNRGPLALGVAALGVAALVMLVAGALVANPFGAASPSMAPSRVPTADPTPRTTTGPSTGAAASVGANPPGSPAALVPADLDGILVAADHAHRLPIFVSIDDAGVARPQSGFTAASVVWQVPVDGYESRYLLVFQEMDAPTVGPVRSARLYLAQWAAEVHGALAHYGGDLVTRTWMAANRGTLFTDLDGLGPGYSAYHRVGFRDAPHNAYTSTDALFRRALKLGGDPTLSASVHLRPFRDDVVPSLYGPVRSIRIPYSTESIGYAFDQMTDTYTRFVGTTPQIDAMDSQGVTARTIVVLYMPFHTDPTIERGHNRPVLGFIGTGRAVVYTEGRAIEAQWSKPSAGAPTRILDADGQELSFVRGRIFFQVVPLGTTVAGALP